MKLKDLDQFHWEYQHLWDPERGKYTIIHVIGIHETMEYGTGSWQPGHIEPHHPKFQEAVALLGLSKVPV
jgi:hypothetical protein